MHSRSMFTFQDLSTRWMKQYGIVFGTYMGFTPWLMVVDPVLIKQVLVGDFAHFPNRIKSNLYHELWDQNLLYALDDSWRRLRTLTTPAFTAAKLRSMQPLMERSVDKLVTYLHKVVSSTDGTLNIKKVITAFSIDVIASTSFATETTELFGAENPVVTNCQDIFELPLWKVAAGFLCPRWFLRVIGLDSFFQKRPFQFLIDLTRHVVRERKRSGERREDLLQLLIDAKVDDEVAELDENNNIVQDKPPKSQAQTLTESEIIAQAIFLFSAGMDTIASTLAHCLFELAHHPQIQEQLHQKITTALAPFKVDKTRKQFEYLETVTSGIDYLDAVINETLRKYPPIVLTLRVTNTDGYLLDGIKLFKEQIIEIPIAALHNCPDYFPEPERFNPDRFMPQNRAKLVPFTFLPFGAGPRNCIGFRFAYQEVKLCLVAILQQFQFNVTPKTPKALQFKLGNPVLCCSDFPVTVSRR